MAAHLKQRKDRGSTWYLVDGPVIRSLHTTKKGLAQHQLEQYIKGKYGLIPTPTVGEFYERWIKAKIEPLFRRSLIRAYRHHFNKYILPAFKGIRLAGIGIRELKGFQVDLLGAGLKVKTCRNIINGSFRAIYRDARIEIEELSGRDPFIDLRWPAAAREKPDPFLPEERDLILDFFREREPFYYPWVLLAFMAGTRPSEASALQVDDLDVETSELSITKTRHLGAGNQPKTGRSRRTIRLSREITESLLTLPSFSLGAESLFLNKVGGPLDANTWAKDYWPRTLKTLEIRPRKFYACRHTFITETVKRGEVLKAIADYVGTSVQMIGDHYCGTLELSLSDRTVFEPGRSKSMNSLAPPTGHSPVFGSASKPPQLLTRRQFKKLKGQKSA